MVAARSDWRREVFDAGPYKGLTRKDVLFHKLADALLNHEELGVDALWNVFPESERSSRGTVSHWRTGWRDWLLDQCPEGCRAYHCSLSYAAVVVPRRSRKYADQIRKKLRARRKSKANLANRVPVTSVRLSDDEAIQGDRDTDFDYSPQDSDQRKVVERQIRERRGQQQFRDALRERYGDCCLVTGCEFLAVLEAAHIRPYRGENDNHPANGLLLRADIHTLFDLDRIGIDPDGLQVEIAPELAKDDEYASLAGKRPLLRGPPSFIESVETALRTISEAASCRTGCRPHS